MIPTAELQAIRATVQELIRLNTELVGSIQRAIAGSAAHTVSQRLSRLELLIVSEWGVPWERIKSKARPNHIVEPRHAAMALAVDCLGLSLQRVGDWIGGRVHGSVANAVRRVRDRSDVDEGFRVRMERLRRLLMEARPC